MSRLRKNEYVVGKELPLVDFLLFRCSFLPTREHVQDLVSQERVLVDGVVARDLNQPLTLYSTLIILTSEDEEPSVSKEYTVLYEDDSFLIVNKPGNLPVHPTGKFYYNTLLSLLKDAGYTQFLFPLHRLDKETSGIVVFAKSASLIPQLQHQVISGELKKFYLALVFAKPPQDQGTIDAPLGSITTQGLRNHVVVKSDGKPSQTMYVVLSSTQEYSLLRIQLLTGRKHQIRVHLAHIGCPIVGDKEHGAHPELFIALHEGKDVWDLVDTHLRSRRQLLHASEIEFVHPVTKKRVHIDAPLPSDMVEYIESNVLL